MLAIVKPVEMDYAPRRLFMPFHNRRQRWAALICHRRAGKALDIDTFIPIYPRGFKKMGELVAGDIIFDETGERTSIVEAHPVQIGRPCYAVCFDDGAEIICDEDHLWYTETKANRTWREGRYIKGAGGYQKRGSGYQVRRSGTVKTTKDIAETLVSRGENNHSIPLCGAVDYGNGDLLVDPYIFGLWLGDGHSRVGHFTNADSEIVDALRKYAGIAGIVFKKLHSPNTGKATTYSLRFFGSILNFMGVLYDKHIPDQYLHAGIGQRLALLQGIMDTDGSIDKRGGRRCEVIQKRHVLAMQVVQLVRSLGEKATCSEKVINGRSYYRVTFCPSFNPFRLSRKREIFKSPKSTGFGRQRRIVDVRPVPSRAVRCITVDSPSRLYLASEWFIPTHNTVASLNDQIKRAVSEKKPNGRYAFIFPQRNQAKDTAWKYLKRFAQPLLTSEPRESDLQVDLVGGSMVRLYGADNPDSLRGPYLDGVVFDEFGDMYPDVFYEIVRPMLADRQGWATFIGTVKGNNAFWELFEKAQSDPEWHTTMLKASQTGLIPRAELEDMKRVMGEDRYRQEMECDPTVAIKGAFYSDEMRTMEAEGRIRPIAIDREVPVRTGWDIGRTDSTAITFWQCVGRERRLVDYHESNGKIITAYADVLYEKKYEHGWKYAEHYWPHDMAFHMLDAEKSRIEMMREKGVVGEIVPAHDVLEGINVVRRMLARTWIDPTRCKRIIDALRQYRRAWDSKLQMYRENEFKDWTNNGVDAVRTFAAGFEEPQTFAPQPDRRRRERDPGVSSWAA